MTRRAASVLIPLAVCGAALAGCEGGKAGGYRKEFYIIESGLKQRLEYHFALTSKYPETLSELEEPGASGYKVPTVPKGYYIDYNNRKGMVQVRAESDRAEE